ncbi:MAG: hypothetical protein HC944_02855 [Nanoarchaeota archaeon]|nr:hypothetical protein [Nanoarchaeota archaeon]
MSFFSGLAARTRSFLSSARAQIRPVAERLRLTPRSSGIGPDIYVNAVGLSAATKDVGAFHIFAAPAMRDIIASQLADEGILELQRAVEPINRTGTLKGSFYKERVAPGIYVVKSHEVRAYSIKNGLNANVPAQSLVEWMKTKQEFSDMDDKQKLRVAFAIKKSAATRKGRNSTGKSDVVRLSPTGDRAYDFAEVAFGNLQIRARETGVEITRGMA